MPIPFGAIDNEVIRFSCPVNEPKLSKKYFKNVFEIFTNAYRYIDFLTRPKCGLGLYRNRKIKIDR